MRKICFECGEYLRVKRMGVKVRPKNYYGYFYADLWYCPVCNDVMFFEIAKEEVVSNEVVEFDFNEVEILRW